MYTHRPTLTFSLLAALTVITIAASPALASPTLLVGAHDSPAILGYDAYTGVRTMDPFATDPSMPASELLVGPDGNIYASYHGYDRVSMYAWPSGDPLGTFVGDEPGSGPGIQSGVNLDGPTGMVFAPDGYFYTVANHHYTVLKYDVATRALVHTYTLGSSKNPWDVACDADGDLYVSGYSSDAIYKFNGTDFETFVPSGSGGLDLPTSIQFGPDGHLYVCSSSTDAILRYDGETGEPLPAPSQSGAFFAGGGALDYPYDLEFGPDDNLFVVGAHEPYTSNGVFRYDGTTGEFIDIFTDEGNNSLAFVPEPTALCLLAMGGLILASRRRRVIG